MLCKRCKKRILKGDKFVEIGSDSKYKWYVSVGWWGRGISGGRRVFCSPCAEKEKKRRKCLWKEFFIINVFALCFLFGVAIIFLLKASQT